jgi:MFS family permease
VGVLTTQLEGNISSAILPNVTSDFNALEHLGLVSMVTYIINSSVQPTWSKFADVIGRKPSLLGAIGLFILGCGLCGLAPNFELFMV